jgi:hypothetical protein
MWPVGYALTDDLLLAANAWREAIIDEMIMLTPAKPVITSGTRINKLANNIDAKAKIV